MNGSDVNMNGVRMNLFNAALNRQNLGRPPVWMMRQAGRYHSHYQNLRSRHSFIDLCKNPKLACEVTFGPIQDFDFDAAILFSDLLFPLEAMGMGLAYDPGPQLGWYLRSKADLDRLQSGVHLAELLLFQARALELIREGLSPDKGLLGFVGGPLTLYCYAVEGSHQGGLPSAREGFADGRYEDFMEKLTDLLVENMILQAQAGSDVIAMMDTCAGEFDPLLYRQRVVPYIETVLSKFKARMPSAKVIYYSKGTGPAHWAALENLPIEGIGIDWRQPIQDVLREWGHQWAIQGNVDPHWLFLDPKELETRLRGVFESVLELPAKLRMGWICGLGHGVMPKTPESNVMLFLKLQKEIFA